jgi:thioredoxin 1
MSTKELTKDNFRQTYESNNLVVIDFWAEWCGPCKNFEPVYERVSEKFPDVVFGKIDVESEKEISEHFSVMSIPTLMIIREGLELYCEPGAMSEAQLSTLIEKAKAMDMEEVKKKIAEEEKAASENKNEPESEQ